MNWNVSNIFEARDKQVRLRDGSLALVKLYPGGWEIGAQSRMDVWNACALLNNLEAELVTDGECQKAQQPQTRVVHVKDRVPGAVYIGRTNARYGLPGSPFQNPFHIDKDGTREHVIDLYREYLLNSPQLLEKLPTLRGRVLSCWCHPLACHGDVLVELLEKLYPEQEGAAGADC